MTNTTSTDGWVPSEATKEALKNASVESIGMTKQAILAAGVLRMDLEGLPSDALRRVFAMSVALLAVSYTLEELRDRYEVVDAEFKSRVS